jgi:hypothetical protein
MFGFHWLLLNLTSKLSRSTGGPCNAQEFLLDTVDLVGHAPGVDLLVCASGISGIVRRLIESRGIIYAVLLVGAFIWRDGATNEPDESSRLLPHQAYGLKAIEFLVYVVGLGYFGLIVKTVREIGLKRTVVPDSEAIPMVVVSSD